MGNKKNYLQFLPAINDGVSLQSQMNFFGMFYGKDKEAANPHTREKATTVVR